MCGLVGMAGLCKPSHGKVFRDMLVFDTVRGFDSAGVALIPVGETDNIFIEKELGAPQNIWDWSYSEIMNRRGVIDKDSLAVIGHNRAATIGAVTETNAHPFNYGYITGAHNGSLTSWSDLEGYQELDVDSKAVFNTINIKGIDHTWKSFLGAAALTWWDEKEGTMNLVRNDQRPLSVAYSKDEKTIFWASESWMITVAAMRNGVDLAPRTNDKGEVEDPVFSLKPNILHVFKPSKVGIELLEVRELEKKYQKTTAHFGGTTATRGQTTTQTTFGGSKFINTSWAYGLPKGPVEARGQKVELLYTNGTSVVGKLEDGSILTIFPPIREEFEKFRTMMQDKSYVYYKLNCRPRAYKSSGSGPPLYCCASSSVSFEYSVTNKTKVVERKSDNPKVIPLSERVAEMRSAKKSAAEPMYHYYNKGSVTEHRWNELMDRMSPKQSCLCCTSGLDINDHKEIVWVTAKEAVCPTCAEDPTVMDAINQQCHLFS